MLFFPFTNDFFDLISKAFWDKDKTTIIGAVSEPVTATGYTPVGVDFFLIGERGEQFGPFGAQYPFQLYNQTGRGYFRCSDEAPLVDPTAPVEGPYGTSGKKVERKWEFGGPR